MLGFGPPNDQQPVTWWRGYPIHSALLLVIVHVATMLATTLALAFGFGGLLKLLAFSSGAVMHGAIWQFVTYAFIHPPSLWFAVEMYLLWAFGREVERFFGRRDFFRLYTLLLLLTPVVLTLYSLVSRTPIEYAGSSSLHFSMFIVFAMLFPGAPMLFSITAKWAAVILVAISTLQDLSFQNWPGLISLWACIGAAWAYVGWHRGTVTLPSINLFKRRPKFRVVRSEPSPAAPRKASSPEDASIDDIDPLLDKIAKSGINSLTAAERARLERARAALLKKDPGAR